MPDVRAEIDLHFVLCIIEIITVSEKHYPLCFNWLIELIPLLWERRSKKVPQKYKSFSASPINCFIDCILNSSAMLNSAQLVVGSGRIDAIA